MGGRLTPSTRAAIISYVMMGLAMFLVLWSLTLTWEIWFAISAMVGLGCAVVISGVRPAVLGVVLIGLFCFTASWDDVGIGPVGVRQLFLVLGGLLLAPTLDPRRLPPVPWWLHAYGLSAVVSSFFLLVFPISQAYYNERYATSEVGTALGERPGQLSSLASLLFNNYAIPGVIVLACMLMPRALRWLIAAYVSGAALCCLAAILGYYGVPILLNVFGGVPYPSGVRASGFTSHPLRLGTAGLMAMGPACWLALQPRWILKLTGWGSLPLLLGGLYVSGSRGPILAGVLVLVLCMFLLPTVRRRVHEVTAAVGVAVLALLFAVPSLAQGVLEQARLTTNTTTTVSDDGRREVLAQGLHDFQSSPIFGIGVQFIAEAHTLYVGVLASGGIILGVGFALFNVGSIIAAVQSLKLDRALGGALLATLIGTLWYWTVADLIQTKTVVTIFGFVVALWWISRNEDAAAAWREGMTDEQAELAEVGSGLSGRRRPEGAAS